MGERERERGARVMAIRSMHWSPAVSAVPLRTARPLRQRTTSTSSSSSSSSSFGFVRTERRGRGRERERGEVLLIRSSTRDIPPAAKATRKLLSSSQLRDKRERGTLLEVSASSNELSDSEKGDDDLFYGYTALLCVQALWLVSGLLGTWAFGAWPYGQDAGYYFLGFGETTALLIPQLAAAVVLRSAALRSRLTGTTFKVLNASLLASSALLFVAELFQSISEGGVGFKTLSASVTAVVSFLALRRHGWPTFKLSVGDNNLQTLSKSYLGLTASTGILVALNTFGAGLLSFLFGKVTREVILEPHHFITFAALLAIQGGILHTLQSASVAGEKRLSSDTYKKLNLGSILSSISALVGICWAAKMKCKVLWIFLTLGLYNIAQLGAASTGFYIGKTYKD